MEDTLQCLMSWFNNFSNDSLVIEPQVINQLKHFKSESDPNGFKLIL